MSSLLNLPTTLARIDNPNFLLTPHVRAIEKYLLLAIFGGIKKLMINIPPRHGKSELVSKYFTAWYLTNNPDKRIILASYEADFAAQWSRKTRQLLRKYANYSPCGAKLSEYSQAANRFDMQQGGGMQSAGAGGAITGKGADVFIIDDPIKNDAEAHSEIYRENLWNWYLATAFTRLEPNGVMIFIMTRWHEDDICGRLLNSEGSEWTYLKFPALAEENDPLGRPEGEPLMPARYDINALNKIKKTLGSYWFSAMYQQNPMPQGTGVFKKPDFRYYRKNENIYELLTDEGIKAVTPNRRFITMDLAVKIKESADYTVLGVWDLTINKDLILVDLYRERIEGADHLGLVRQYYEKYKPSEINIENVQYQLALIQMVAKAGLPVREIKADKDKYSRALIAAAKFERHEIYFPIEVDYNEILERELLNFPNGKHDDIVDVISYAAIRAGEYVDLILPDIKFVKQKRFTDNY